MKLSFLDRSEELARLRRLVGRRESSFGVLYGRRRCGKSRLLQEALPADRSVYYVADEREGTLQRAALAREIGRRLPGFDRVAYPDWDALLERWFAESRPGMVLAIDELPALVAAAPEIPSLLQRYVDAPRAGARCLLVAGSSQRMMQGLVLDRTAPLFGRAHEILKIAPLGCGWIRRALRLDDDVAAVEHFALWGGVPRYWELASEHPDRVAAMEALVLSPLGVLYDEPATLLLDEIGEISQAASLLTLIGQGCHRLSEIAGRMGKPATSLSRPIDRLLELGLVRRDIPFGASQRDGKRTAYRIDDPFLRFWFRYVDPNRSRLEARQIRSVAREIETTWPQHVAGIWEELVRESVARTTYFGRRWRPASSWWGPGLDRAPMEIDVVAESEDGGALLLGEVKWSDDPAVLRRAAMELRRKAERFPLVEGREAMLGVWSRAPARSLGEGVRSFTCRQVVTALR